MKTFHSISELGNHLKASRMKGLQIALVPTMGNLHEGHLQLIDIAKQHADVVVCSIFVNPTQFGENEDFGAYPRTLEMDSQLLENRNCDILFAPSLEQVYPKGASKKQMTEVLVPGLSNILCGEFRPGHFSGVATVVSKLFNMVQPDVAIFGEKDFQQLAVIRTFAEDLNFPVKIISAPIARAENGLALSSRNNYLSEQEKQQASLIFKLLSQNVQKIKSGERNYRELQQQTMQVLKENNFRPDYFEIRNSLNLNPANTNDKNLVILCAAFLNRTRLIDNIAFSLD